MKLYKWEEAKEIIKSGNYLLEFTTSWCGDCKMMEPVIKEAEEKIKNIRNDIKFIQVDAEEADLFRKEETEFEVLKVPSLFVIKNGAKQHLGYKYIPSEKIVEYFRAEKNEV